MERESFHDEEIAKFLNATFVCIKVDREERPDVDSVYMTSLHMVNQLDGNSRGGGWPLSMFLTDAAEPFFGGTYFPARDGDRHAGSTGFLTIVTKLHEMWGKDTKAVRERAATVVKFTKAELERRRGALTVALSDALLVGVQDSLAEDFDPKYGGFGYTCLLYTSPSPRDS